MGGGYCNDKLATNGWVRTCAEERYLYQKKFNEDLVRLSVYVDDFIAGGPESVMPEVWSEIKSLLHMEDETEVGKFLGIDIKLNELDESTKILIFSQCSYAESIVDEYKKDMNITKPLKKVDAPFFFSEVPGDDLWEKGKFAEKAARYVGKLMYLQRGSRPDIAFIVCKLARCVSCWCKVHDIMLTRIMQYLQHTYNYGLHYRINTNDNGRHENHLWVDADHAGDIHDAKSTGGALQGVVGPDSVQAVGGASGTFCVIDWASKKQRATAQSSAEAEVVAIANHIKPGIRNWQITEALMGKQQTFRVREDSSAAIGAIRKGYSPMDYISKTQKVRISGLHELFHGPEAPKRGIVLSKEPSRSNLADIFTKEVDRECFLRLRDSIGVLKIE